MFLTWERVTPELPDAHATHGNTNSTTHFQLLREQTEKPCGELGKLQAYLHCTNSAMSPHHNQLGLKQREGSWPELCSPQS